MSGGHMNSDSAPRLQKLLNFIFREYTEDLESGECWSGTLTMKIREQQKKHIQESISTILNNFPCSVVEKRTLPAAHVVLTWAPEYSKFILFVPESDVARAHDSNAARKYLESSTIHVGYFNKSQELCYQQISKHYYAYEKNREIRVREFYQEVLATDVTSIKPESYHTFMKGREIPTSIRVSSVLQPLKRMLEKNYSPHFEVDIELKCNALGINSRYFRVTPQLPTEHELENRILHVTISMSEEMAIRLMLFGRANIRKDIVSHMCAFVNPFNGEIHSIDSKPPVDWELSCMQFFGYPDPTLQELLR